MSRAIPEAVALFQSQLQNRRFDDRTLGILETVLVARDVQSLLQTRAALREVLRSEASIVIGGVSEMTVDQKLRTVQFFVAAFALVGDIESCLALKYEALILRESKHLQVYGLQVSYEEWLTFAKDSLDNGFYPIAIQGFEKALQCIQINKIKDPEFAVSFMKEHTINDIKNMKNLATSLVATNSVAVRRIFEKKSNTRAKMRFMFNQIKQCGQLSIQKWYKQKEHATAAEKPRPALGNW